jgi:hypothetical protein
VSTRSDCHSTCLEFHISAHSTFWTLRLRQQLPLRLFVWQRLLRLGLLKLRLGQLRLKLRLGLLRLGTWHSALFQLVRL